MLMKYCAAWLMCSANQAVICDTTIYALAPGKCLQRRYVFGLSVYRVRPSICLFVQVDRVSYHDISWLAWAVSMKLTGNIY